MGILDIFIGKRRRENIKEIVRYENKRNEEFDATTRDTLKIAELNKKFFLNHVINLSDEITLLNSIGRNIEKDLEMVKDPKNNFRADMIKDNIISKLNEMLKIIDERINTNNRHISELSLNDETIRISKEILIGENKWLNGIRTNILNFSDHCKKGQDAIFLTSALHTTILNILTKFDAYVKNEKENVNKINMDCAEIINRLNNLKKAI